MENDRLLKLVEAYQKHFKQYSRPDYNETEVRNDFVNPFFEILGWDVQNKKNLPQHLREVKHEASVFVEENGKQVKKKPDYEFHVGSTPYFFLETKKPNVDIMASKEAAFQTRRYGWNGNLEISVLSNFTDLVIYDTSVRPNENDKPSVAQVAHFHFTEYVDKFDEISRLLSYETVVSGAFEKTFENISSSLKKEPFDKYFLSQIKEWRLVLSEDIVKNNSTINQETLNIFVQKLINRIVFLRICEDRELEKYESLKNIGTYAELKKVFTAADKKYDSGLFELIDGEQFEISDSILVDIFKELYYPNSCYEFSIVDPFIIGQIYELFLEEEIVIKDGIVVAERKPEIVDSQGVVNTPKNIADIIVKTTLTPLFSDEKFTEWDSYRIADICCGSGNFLLSAYEFIINRYIEYYMKNCLDMAIQKGLLISDVGNNFKLSYEKKREILQNNIWGVDIDILAVEVAKFSLLIKLIEDSSLYEMESFVKNNNCRILPSLDNNIKNGNSLVDEKYIEFNSNILNNPEMVEKIKIFNWENEFEGEKFDAIVGNPPYIRVQNMVHFSENEYEYYKEELCKRSINNMSENNWYQFGRSQSLKRFVKGEHLVWSVLATQGNYVYDTRTICFTGGGNGPFYGLEKKEDTRESLFYIQAVLNYWMIEMVVKSKASKFRGDYYSHGKQFVAQLPIYRINFDDSNEVKIHDAIVDTVKKLMELKNKRDQQQTKPQKETYKRLIQIEDKKLDGLISKLYGAENCRREDLDEE